MNAKKDRPQLPHFENIITSDSAFPVDVFVQDNLKRPVEVDEHFHDCFELLFFLNGEARQYLNGKEFIAREGDLVLIKSGDIHATYCKPSSDCRILVLKFMPTILDAGYIRIEGSKYLVSFLNHAVVADLRNLAPDELAELRCLMLKLLDEYSAKAKAYEMRIKGHIYEFVALLIRYDLVTVPDADISSVDSARIAKVVEMIERDHHKPLTLKDIASKLNMNYSYVSRYFKKITGKNFKEYLDYIRVCESERMMLERASFIYEIAERCGFASVQSFNRVYRRIRGRTPREIFKK